MKKGAVRKLSLVIVNKTYLLAEDINLFEV